jgi:hypothetical protein
MAGRKRPDMRCLKTHCFSLPWRSLWVNSQAISFHFLPIREIKATFIFIHELCVTCSLYMAMLSPNCLLKLVKFHLPLTNRFSLNRTLGFFPPLRYIFLNTLKRMLTYSELVRHAKMTYSHKHLLNVLLQGWHKVGKSRYVLFLKQLGLCRIQKKKVIS